MLTELEALFAKKFDEALELAFTEHGESRAGL